MVTKASWVAGLGQGLTWGTLINSTDIASMATANTSLSTVTVANGTALDMFMDISAELAIASSTIAAGANLAFWIAALEEDGTILGDNKLTAGTPAALTPAWAPCAVIPLFAAATQTTLIGVATQIILPPGDFAVAIQNNSGFTLTSGTQTVTYRTYNIAMT
jgi:hypothetical protein